MERLLVLVRHGQSEWNLKNLFTGWKNPDLTEQGIKEARTAGQTLKEMKLEFDEAFTSDLLRAQRTLDLMQEEMGTDLPVTRDQALNERDYGDITGMNKDEARKQFGEEQVHIWRRSYDVPPPGGESLKMTAERVLPYFDKEILPRCFGWQAHLGFGPWQLAARFDHAAGRPDAGRNPQERTWVPARPSSTASTKRAASPRKSIWRNSANRPVIPDGHGQSGICQTHQAQ
jgi:2,3-bisphosphoglycerate-dependent phosphoglycerate mutase